MACGLTTMTRATADLLRGPHSGTASIDGGRLRGLVRLRFRSIDIKAEFDTTNTKLHHRLWHQGHTTIRTL